MDYKTYDEWKTAGFQVLKGEKSIWHESRHCFSKNQVKSIYEIYDVLRLL